MMSGQNFPTETCMPPLRLRPAPLACGKHMHHPLSMPTTFHKPCALLEEIV